MRLIYRECDHVVCYKIYEDQAGVFWEEDDTPPITRIDSGCRETFGPGIVARMRRYGVSEETIKRIVGQVEGKGENHG